MAYQGFSERYGFQPRPDSGGFGSNVYREMQTWWRTNPNGGVELIPPDELRQRQEQEEIRRCREDPVYFANNYCYVQGNPNAAGPAISVTYTTVNSSLNLDDLLPCQQDAFPQMNVELTEPEQGRGQVTWDSPNANPRADIAAVIDQWIHYHMYRDNDEALKKSKELLCSFLTDEQVAELEKANRITIKGSEGNWYRIFATTTAYNVKMLDKSRSKWKWIGLCAVPYGYLPIYDTVLSQMLALQTDEAGFLKVANREWPPNLLGESIANGIVAGITNLGEVNHVYFEPERPAQAPNLPHIEFV